MRLTSKLMGWLSRAFDRDPLAFLGLRIRYNGTSMTWQVYDGVLTTAVSGGTGSALTIDLSAYTLQSLAAYVAQQPGYSVPFLVSADLYGASALRLLEATGSQGESNGDHLFVYTSPLYAILDAYAVELSDAELEIAELPNEMSTPTADGGWLDYLGSYYAVPRQAAEMDGVYSLRIVAEVLRPLGNNLAIEQAIADFTGQDVSITDVVIYSGQPRFDGTVNFDGSYPFLPGTHPIYGLFDASVGYDLLGGDPPALEAARLRQTIERLRDAGTQLRALTLGGSKLSDATPGVPTDNDDTLVITHRRNFDGTFNFGGTTSQVVTSPAGSMEVPDGMGGVGPFLIASPDVFQPVFTFSGPAREIGTISTSAAAVPFGAYVNQMTLTGGALQIPDGNGGAVVLLVGYES